MKPSLLEVILNNPDKLTVRFQPIFRMSGGQQRVDSVEGLMRGPQGTNLERADLLFDYVRRKRAEAAIDRICVRAICTATLNLPADIPVNINVHASTLGQDDSFVDFFLRQTNKLGLPCDRFTLEIVEHSPTHNVPGLILALKRLRDSGVRIALDDVGLGHSNYRMIVDSRPDYFKLDAFFVDGVSQDTDRHAVVDSIMCLAERMRGVVVAEGVRSHQDLSCLMEMGVQLFQAHLLAPPTTVAELTSSGILETRSAVADSAKNTSDELIASAWTENLQAI